MILSALRIGRAEFEAGTGWQLKPEGACRGDVCVPLGGEPGAEVDVEAVAPRLGMPLLHDRERGLWSLGPASVTGRALATAEAPDLQLPDARTGETFSLSSLRGRKTILVAWASW